MLAFLTLILLVAALGHFTIFIYNRYLLCLPPSPFKKPIRYGWLFLGGVLPGLLLLIFFNHEQVQHILSWRGFRENVPIYIAMMALFAFFFTRGLIWLQERFAPEPVTALVSETTRKPQTPPVQKKLPRAVQAFETTDDLYVIERELTIPGLAPAFDGFTIAHVTDVHFKPSAGLDNFFESIVHVVNGLDADVLAFTGDFADRRKDIPRAVEYHSRFKARLGAVCVLGNHDYWVRPEALLEELRGASIRWLGGGERRVLKRHGRRLIFCGTDAPWDKGQADLQRLARRGTGDAVVMLSHTPDNAPEAANAGASLILSGHVHGGQVCLPLIGPMIVPSRYGTRYAAGLYNVGADSILNVSRGIGVSSAGVRILCPPDVCLLRLRAPHADVMVGAVSTAKQVFKPVESRVNGVGAWGRSSAKP